ncbi:NACHT domain-containing NTPase [Leifsonia sp. EB34]|uniref:NACHT domain-containing protein n=1 Tax=Leifsonia sp. EB34 TaxID=3156303 RepID=UPI003511DB72
MIVEQRFVGKVAVRGDFTPEDDHALHGIEPLLSLISRKASLVLGEPGSGKSTAVRCLADSIRDSGANTRSSLLDLKQCYSSESLERDFASLPEPIPGVDNILLLDSIDEIPTLINRSVAFFERKIPHLIDKGWRVIAMSRTAETVAALGDLFEEMEQEALHTLLPLRRSDAWSIVSSFGINADDLLAHLELRSLGSLASLPFMLRLLCEMYVDSGTVGESRTEILENAVPRLLARASREEQPALPPSRARAAAERIALYATVSPSNGISLFVPGQDLSGLSLEGVEGSQPLKDGEVFDITFADMQWLLHAPLFAEAGPSQRQFIHRSVRDYLAANAVRNLDVRPELLRSLITTSDGGRSIPPQMLGLATDLLAISTRHDWLVQCDPFSLAKNGVARERSDLAPMIVEALLRDADGEEVLLRFQDTLSDLDHSGLVEQLKPALAGRDSERVVALRILRDSYVPGLETELLRLVYSREGHYRVRKLAADVLASQRKIDLVDISRLSDSFFEGDSDDELRGALLNHLWPTHLETRAVLDLLVRPAPHFLGSYSMFLHRFGRELDRRSAEAVARWHAHELRSASLHPEGRFVLGRRMRELADEAVQRLIPLPRDTGLRDDIADLLNDRILQHETAYPLAIDDLDEDDWEDMLLRQLRRIREIPHGWYSVVTAFDAHKVPVVGPHRIDWLLSQLDHSGSDRPRWLEVIQFVSQPYDPHTFELFWGRQGTDVWEAMRGYYEPIELTSDLAAHFRDAAARAREMKRGTEAESVPRERFITAVRDLLVGIESDPGRFWILARWLGLDESLGRWDTPGPTDVLAAEGIDLLSVSEREQVLEAARRYLDVYSGVAPKRIRLNVIYFSSLAAFRALHTVMVHCGEGGLNAVLGTNPRHFVAAILEYPAYDSTRDEVSGTRRRVLRLVRDADAQAFRASVRRYLERCGSAPRETSAVSDLEHVLGKRYSTLVRSVLDSATFHLDELLGLLFAVDADRAQEWCVEQLNHSDNIDRLVEALSGLLSRYPVVATHQIIELVRGRPEQAASALLQFAVTERFERARWVRVPEMDRMMLYEALVDLLPTSPEGGFEAGPEDELAFRRVTPQDEFARWTDSLITQVARAGTSASLDAIRDLAQRRPDLGVGHYVALAREALRINGWRPLALQEFLAIASGNPAQIIRSTDDALEAVIHELDVLYRWLTGETPQAFALWNVSRDSQSKNPKDENTISDWYCHGLRTRLSSVGLIVNREVEVRNNGRGVGHRQDIRIELVDTAAGETYTIVVEVKGSWNPEVRTSLPTQLADDYLRRGNLTHGVFLVVDFSGGPISNSRKQSASLRHMRGLEEALAIQVESLPSELRVVPVIHAVP